jgi:hypothetical protein
MLSRSEASLCPARQPIRFAQGKLREGAQGDSGGADFIILLIFFKLHYHITQHWRATQSFSVISF